MGSIPVGGSQLSTATIKKLRAAVEDSLKKVMDPELGISIVDLGLVYEVKVYKLLNKEGYGVEVMMTLTSPGCPLAGVIDQKVNAAARGVEGIKKVDVKLVWEPMWSIDMVSEEVRMELGRE